MSRKKANDSNMMEFTASSFKINQEKNLTGNNYAVFQREYKKFQREKMFDSARMFLSEED